MSISPRSEVPTRVSSAKDRSKRRERERNNTGEMSVAAMLQPACVLQRGELNKLRGAMDLTNI